MPTRYISVASAALLVAGLAVLAVCVITRKDPQKIAGEKSFRGRAITFVLLLLGLGVVATNSGCCYMQSPPEDPAQIHSPDRIAAHNRLEARLAALEKFLESNQLKPEVISQSVFEIKNDIAKLKNYYNVLLEDRELIEKADVIIEKAEKFRYPGMGDKWISIKQDFEYVSKMAAQQTTTTKERAEVDDRIKDAQQRFDWMILQGNITKEQAALLVGLLQDMKAGIELSRPSDLQVKCYEAMQIVPARRTIDQLKVRIAQVDKIFEHGDVDPAVMKLVIPQLEADLKPLNDYDQLEKDKAYIRMEDVDTYRQACELAIHDLKLRIDLVDRINALGRVLAALPDNAESRKEIAEMLSYIDRLQNSPQKKKYPLSAEDSALIESAKAFVAGGEKIASVQRDWEYVNETFVIARRIVVQKIPTTTKEREELDKRVEDTGVRIDSLVAGKQITPDQAILLKGLLAGMLQDIKIDPPADFYGTCYIPMYSTPITRSIEKLRERLVQLRYVLVGGDINPKVAELTLMQLERDIKPLEDTEQLKKERAAIHMKEIYSDAEKERDECKLMIKQMKVLLRLIASFDTYEALLEKSSGYPIEARKRIAETLQEAKRLNKLGELGDGGRGIIKHGEALLAKADKLVPASYIDKHADDTAKNWQNINDTFAYARKLNKKQTTTTEERRDIDRAVLLTNARMERMVVNGDMTKYQADLLGGLLQDIIEEIKVNPPSDCDYSCYMMDYTSPAIRSLKYLKVRISQVNTILERGDIRPEVAQLAIMQLESELKPLENQEQIEEEYVSKEDAAKFLKEGKEIIVELKKHLATPRQVDKKDAAVK